MTVPASLLVSSCLCIGAFAVFLVFLAHTLSPKIVGGAFAHVEARVQRWSRLARTAIGDGARVLGDVARKRIYALAKERARRASASVVDVVGGMKMTAMAKWGGFKEAAVAAFYWLRLIAGVANLGATVLGWRGVKGIIKPPPNDEAAVPRVSKPDTTLLVVWISAIVMYCALVLVLDALCSGMTTFAWFFACFAALCGFALMEAERSCLWDFYDIATTASSSSSSTANEGRRVGHAGEGTADLALRDVWNSLWFLIILTYFSDAVFLCIVLGKRPLALAFLAIFKLTAHKLAKQVCLTADDGEEAAGSRNGSAQVDVNKWHRTAMVVLAIESAKVVVTYLFMEFFFGALCFASLCATTAILFDEEVCRPGEHALGHDENQESAGLAMHLAGHDEDSGHVHDRECAGLARDLAGDGAEGYDDRAEDSSAVAASDHEKEGTTTDERSYLSDSEEEAEELQRHEEPDHGSSSSMNDWSYVDYDPTMPVEANGAAGRKFSILSMRVRG